MRKIVIDGSNTAGFQRTAVVGLGGRFAVEGTEVGVQSVTLEEDAARILGEDGIARRFALDRLGVALVEVALDPVRGDPEFVGKVALHLGRMLRSTGRVARGLGTIRQDLNISVRGGRVVEVKGVQKLNLLPKVVEYEKKRQLGLLLLAEKLMEKGVDRVVWSVQDVTGRMAESGSKVVRNQVSAGGGVFVIRAKGLSGLLGWEPYPGIRLGKEVAEVARANSLGGVIHSDEFAVQGILEGEEATLREATDATEGDALILVAGPRDVVQRCLPALTGRLQAAIQGVPAETRAATETGETRYMRPRPGSHRMYPETDIPNILLTSDRLKRLAKLVPENWESEVDRLSREYSLSGDLALKVYDSDIAGTFESLCGELKLEPSLVASVLVDLPPRLAREGVPEGALSQGVLTDVLSAVAKGRAAKEAIPEILKVVGDRGTSVEGAIALLGLEAVDESRVRSVVDSVIEREAKLIRERGEAAFSPLMGEAMRELRGKADGATVGRILRERLAQVSDSK